jgi:hypothetical protein
MKNANRNTITYALTGAIILVLLLHLMGFLRFEMYEKRDENDEVTLEDVLKELRA